MPIQRLDGLRGVLLFLVGAALGAVGTLQTTLALSKGKEKKDREANSYDSRVVQQNKISLSEAINDEILAEQFTRNIQFFGVSGQQQILDAFVVVVGLGGVGSHAAHMLLRAGVGKLRLIDFDQVTLSSLNRHAVATRADVGLPKATVLKDHFLRTVPEADIDARVAMFTDLEADSLLEGAPDFVIDAIDDINTKVALLEHCQKTNLQVICVCGAGAKADPTRVRVTDISEASCDPLARKVRYQLRSRYNVTNGIPMVISAERPRCSLIAIEQLTHAPHDLQIIPNFRVRTVPVLGSTPAIFGMAAASWVLCELADQPFVPEPLFRVKEKEILLLLERLIQREEVVFGNRKGVDLDGEDISFLARDVWRAKSARSIVADSSGEKGLSRFLSNLQLTRWDVGKPAALDNLILLSDIEAEQHEATTLKDLRAAEPAFVELVETKLLSVRIAIGSSETIMPSLVNKNLLFDVSLSSNGSKSMTGIGTRTWERALGQSARQ